MIEIKQHTDDICTQAMRLMHSNHLTRPQRDAVARIKQYTQHLATAAQQVAVNDDQQMVIRHNLINMLTPVVGYVEMLADEWVGALDVTQEGYIHQIQESVEAIRAILLSHRYRNAVSESA